MKEIELTAKELKEDKPAGKDGITLRAACNGLAGLPREADYFTGPYRGPPDAEGNPWGSSVDHAVLTTNKDGKLVLRLEETFVESLDAKHGKNIAASVLAKVKTAASVELASAEPLEEKEDGELASVRGASK